MTVENEDVRWFSFLGVILLAVFAYIFLPRYEWKSVSNDRSVSIIVHDRWTGRMQRAVYDDSGSLNVMGVYVPF